MSLSLKSQQLEKALQIYSESHRTWMKQGKDTQNLQRALKVWQRLSSKYQDHNSENLKRSLIISEQAIALSDEDKIAVANALRQFLDDSRLRRNSTQDETPLKVSEKDLTETRARELAIEVATILDPYIELHDPQIQRAIENANASSLANIEPGMSARTKASLGEAMASAVEKNLATSAEKLAQNLIRYYRVPLSENTINFLVKTYEADRERLRFIARYETPLSARYSLSSTSAQVPPPKESWQIDLYNAKKTLNRFL